ncbi:hypothetical protein O3G_MSEX000215 [Manduca sexta]|nr:hypothetical protein O3G_MSEX000215 [Manduca sexta]
MEGEIFGILSPQTSGNRILLENATNWHSWKFQVKVLLKALDIFDIVDGSNTCPKEDGEKITTWTKLDAKAQGVIVNRLSSGVMLQVQNCETAKEIWDRLCTVYEQKSDVSLHILQQRFFDLKYTNSEDVVTFIAKVEGIVAQIRQARGEIPDNMIITKIISSLGEKFRHFISAWDSVPIEKKNMTELTARLIIEEQRNKMYEDEKPSQIALKTNTKKEIRKCFNCGKVGHYKSDCKVKRQKSIQNENIIICKLCKKRGHTLKQCWFNKDNKNQSVNDEKQNALVMSVCGLTSKIVSNEWFLDSGASEHMCSTKDSFINYENLIVPKDVIIGDGTVIKALGYGDIQLEAYDNEQWIKTLIKNVLYVPSLKANLFPMSATLDKGYKLLSTAMECQFTKNNNVHAVAKRQGKMYIMMFRKLDESAMVGKVTSNLKQWHAKLGHQDINQVKNVLTRQGVRFEEKGEEETCVSCLRGKQHKFPFPLSQNRATKPGEIIHIDIGGPVEETSLGGAKFFLLLKDDFTKYRKVYFLKNKSESIECLKLFLKQTQVNPGHKINFIRSDNAKEFCSRDMENLLNSYGIQHQKCVAYTPQQNGCIEREMKTVIESARTMLLESGFNKNLWAEALNTAVYVINRTGPSRVKDRTPFELWWDKTYDVNNLQVFGSRVSVHVPDQKRLKFDSKAEIGYFIGYGENIKGYRIYLPEKNEVEIKRDVIFITESEESKEQEKRPEMKYYRGYELLGDVEQISEKGSQYEDTTSPNIMVESDDDHDSMHIFHEHLQIEEEIENHNLQETSNQTEEETERPRRVRSKPKWLNDYVQGEESDENSFISYTCQEPTSYQEAMTRPDKSKWEEAINTELRTLQENNTWEEVTEVPEGENIISSKWVFTIKETEEKSIYKARLVARGFEQKNCDDKTYSPVAKLTTFKALMAVANQKRQPVYQMDVTSAFLYGDINETVFIQLPNNKIGKLNKSIYGLKKSPKYWNTKFNNFMLKENFVRSQNDPCLYMKHMDKNYIYVMLFVDDLLYFGSNKEQVDSFKNVICDNFKMKDLGLASYYLGINIKQDLKNYITVINQKKYLYKLLTKYQMLNCKTVSTPIEQNFNFELLNREKSESLEIEKSCRSLIGSLLYATCTRPDLSVAVGFLSRYVHCASLALFKCLKRVLRYISGTIDLSLTYKCDNIGQNVCKLQGFSDSDWAGDILDRKSTSGQIFYIFECPISWCSKKQSCVSLSSCEAEYVALSSAIMEGSFLRKLMLDFGYTNTKFEILEDNQSVINIVHNNDSNKRLKHIDIKYQYIVENIMSKELVKINYINSNNNVADLFTKPLGKQLFIKLRNKILF